MHWRKQVFRCSNLFSASPLHLVPKKDGSWLWTDHKSSLFTLIRVLYPAAASPGFHIIIHQPPMVYLPGGSNVVADTLSCPTSGIATSRAAPCSAQPSPTGPPLTYGTYIGLRQIHSTQVQSLQYNDLVELLYPAPLKARSGPAALQTTGQSICHGCCWASTGGQRRRQPHTRSGSVWLSTHFTWPIFRFP